jgi:hypothetical protein
MGNGTAGPREHRNALANSMPVVRRLSALMRLRLKPRRPQ